MSMTRFSLSVEKAVEIVLWSIKNSVGGEIIIPKIPSYKLNDLANAVSAKSKVKVIGIRPGEKIHEEMVTSMDSYNTFSFKNYYVIEEFSTTSTSKLFLDPSIQDDLEEGTQIQRVRFNSVNNININRINPYGN